MDNLAEHAKKILEFQEVKENIAKYSHWSWSREQIKNLTPFSDLEDIYEYQSKVRQIGEILAAGETLGLSGIEDITDAVKAATKDIVLSLSDFTFINRNIEITASLKKSLLPWTHLPFVYETVGDLALTPQLGESIGRTFDETGEIRDNASDNLFSLRLNIRNLESDIHRKLNALLRDTAKQKMYQDLIYTVREGRFVIPIKQEFRGIFEGLVMDISTSGATVFMEPIAVVEMNNNLRQYRIEEKLETDRILRGLSAAVARSGRELLANLTLLADFDMFYAVALFAAKTKSIMPQINTSGNLILKKARHPLLYEKAIPLDIEIGKDFRTLVITGPNTGGKTVTLKTVGLFTLMGCSGLPIPADEGSEIALFQTVYADIGDDQSIAQNLSTFSSHMNQIISIINHVPANCLVLLDELGAGTDPREGTALGVALLEYLTSIGARTVVTTHYGELKYFAANHPLARNAAMEFDSDTLLPSYRINIGRPGRSCALAIVSRLGLPEKLIKRAEELITHEYIELDNLLADIENKEKMVNEELDLHQKFRGEAQRLKQKYEEELSLVKTEQTELLIEAAGEAEALILAAKNEIKKAVHEFRKKMHLALKAGKDEDMAQASAAASSKLDDIIVGLEKFKKKRSIAKLKKNDGNLKVGDKVYVPSLDRKGIVLEIKNDEVLLQVDKLKTRLPIWNVRTNLEKEEPKPKEKQNFQMGSVADADHLASINLIGLYVDEAIYKLEKFIDESIYNQKTSVHVVHGKGTGALRNGVHQYLRKHPMVYDFRLGQGSEGSSGVTIVYFK